jgi:Putative prokaryotic signal transducing protein
MQTVHRARSLADAQNARDVLVRCGVTAHIADEVFWGTGELSGTDAIRVMVDNRSVDRARRALQAWKKEAGGVNADADSRGL